MVSVAQIPATSTEYLHVTVEGGGAPHTVQLAVIDRSGEPADDDWHTGSWDGEDALLLVGPDGDVTLTPGTYTVWVKVGASPETPIRRSGTVKVGGY